MVLSGSIWKECTYNGISTGAYIVFYQGGTIDNFTYVSGKISQYSAESEYNSAFTAVASLAHFRMLNN